MFNLFLNSTVKQDIAVADPGFPDGGLQPLDLRQKRLIWQDICRKLHEKERIWTEGGCMSLARPLDPPMH